MSPVGSSSLWTRFFLQYSCGSCGAEKGYRSRYRGPLEQVVLFPLLLKPVRCDRCYHRSYVMRWVPLLERGAPVGKLDNQSYRDTKADSRVA